MSKSGREFADGMDTASPEKFSKVNTQSSLMSQKASSKKPEGGWDFGKKMGRSDNLFASDKKVNSGIAYQPNYGAIHRRTDMLCLPFEKSVSRTQGHSAPQNAYNHEILSTLIKSKRQKHSM